jgi:hypothetical protein
MKQWSEERCSEQPKELELVADGIYIQRRNIKAVEHEADEDMGMDAYTEYVCESREIPVSEYEMLKSIEEIDTSQAIDNYTMQLMSEGVI